MVAVALAIVAAATAVGLTEKEGVESVQSLLREESPDVFLAKATLQQYLSRVVRRDWDGVKRLTHPKARSLQPWAVRNDELKTFDFKSARSAGPGAVVIEMAEDVFHRDSQEMSTGDPAVYMLFRSRGSWRVGDRKAGAHLRSVSNDAVRTGYPGWVDHAGLAQARRESRVAAKHR